MGNISARPSVVPGMISYPEFLTIRDRFKAGQASRAEMVQALRDACMLRLDQAERQADAYRAPHLVVPEGHEMCQRCGGNGGFSGWPGYTCFDCGGRGYL